MAVLDLLDLPADLEVDGLLHELEAVEVLDLAARAQRCAGLAHRHVGVAAEAALLHIAVADADPGHDLVQLARIGHGLVAGTDVGLGHDLEQRRARAVEVDAALADEVFVQRLAGVFLEVGAHQAHGLLLVAEVEADLAALHDGDFELADLVALGQVGIEIILAREDAARSDGGSQRQPELDRALDGAHVHHGQGAGQREVDRAGLRVGLGAEGRGRAAEDLGLRGQLGVRLEADHDFIALDQFALAHLNNLPACGGGNR